jgi:hypothetical protein
VIPAFKNFYSLCGDFSFAVKGVFMPYLSEDTVEEAG